MCARLWNWTQFAAPAVFGIAMRVYARTRLTELPVHTLVVSNVPGPHIPLYMLGCEVKAMFPLGAMAGEFAIGMQELRAIAG
jgi:diacylglycerol O-acyltransferase